MNKNRLNEYSRAVYAVSDQADDMGAYPPEEKMHRTLSYMQKIMDNAFAAIKEGEAEEACVYLDTLSEVCRDIFSALSEDSDTNKFLQGFEMLQSIRENYGLSVRDVPEV